MRYFELFESHIRVGSNWFYDETPKASVTLTSKGWVIQYTLWYRSGDDTDIEEVRANDEVYPSKEAAQEALQSLPTLSVREVLRLQFDRENGDHEAIQAATKRYNDKNEN